MTIFMINLTTHMQLSVIDLVFSLGKDSYKRNHQIVWQVCSQCLFGWLVFLFVCFL